MYSRGSQSGSQPPSTAKEWIVRGVLVGAALAVAVGARSYLGRSRKFRSRVVGIIPARFASSRFPESRLPRSSGNP